MKRNLRYQPAVWAAALSIIGAYAAAPAMAAAGEAGAASHWQELKRYQGLWTKPQPETGLFNLAPLAQLESPESPVPPLKGDYLKQFEALNARLTAITQGVPQPPRAGPPGGGGCMGGAMPEVMLGGLLLEFVASPSGLYIISEQDAGVRRIYTDGRGHPSSDDLIPSHLGHSIGHWEGKTLVVDTIGILEGMIDGHSSHSDALHITERFQLLDDNTLQSKITLEDPKALSRPWSSTRTYTRSKYTEALDPDCDRDKPGARSF